MPMRPIFPDKPDAFVCVKCGAAHSCRLFNCTCGYMDCGHGWRTGGEMRDACQPCVNELWDLRDAVKVLLDLGPYGAGPIDDEAWEKLTKAYERLTRKG